MKQSNLTNRPQRQEHHQSLRGMISYCFYKKDESNSQFQIETKQSPSNINYDIKDLILQVTFMQNRASSEIQKAKPKHVEINKLYFDACNDVTAIRIELKNKQHKCIGFCEFPLKKFFQNSENKHNVQVDIIDYDKYNEYKQFKKCGRLKLQLFCYVEKPEQYGLLTIHRAVFNPNSTKLIYDSGNDRDLDACLQLKLAAEHYTLQSYKIAGGKVFWNSSVQMKISSLTDTFQATVADSWSNRILGVCHLHLPDFFVPTQKTRAIVVDMEKDKNKVGTLEIYVTFKLASE